MPFQGIHEMMMLGTASHNPVLPPECSKNPITSDLTCEEMWNLTNMGYARSSWCWARPCIRSASLAG